MKIQLSPEILKISIFETCFSLLKSSLISKRLPNIVNCILHQHFVVLCLLFHLSLLCFSAPLIFVLAFVLIFARDGGQRIRPMCTKLHTPVNDRCRSPKPLEKLASSALDGSNSKAKSFFADSLLRSRSKCTFLHIKMFLDIYSISLIPLIQIIFLGSFV